MKFDFFRNFCYGIIFISGELQSEKIASRKSAKNGRKMLLPSRFAQGGRLTKIGKSKFKKAKKSIFAGQRRKCVGVL